MTAIKELLTQLARINGIDTALVVSRDGFIIEAVSRSIDIDTEAVGAVISTQIGITENIGRELKIGAFNQIMLECDRGVAMMSMVGDEVILVVMCSLGINLGNIRYQVKKVTPEIEKAL